MTARRDGAGGKHFGGKISGDVGSSMDIWAGENRTRSEVILSVSESSALSSEIFVRELSMAGRTPEFMSSAGEI